MDISRKIMWSVYVGVIGTAATVVAQQGLKALWKAATGDNPPDPSDPREPFAETAAWAAASAIGVGVAQLAARRFAAKRWDVNMAAPVKTLPTLKVDVK